MNAYELADYLDNNVEAMLHTEQQYIDQAAIKLRELHDMYWNMHNLNNKHWSELQVLKDQLDGCTCQGGHSEAWLRAKGRLK